MRDRLTWQLTESKTNYCSSHRCSGLKGKAEVCSRCSQCPRPFSFGRPRGHLEVSEQSSCTSSFLPQALQSLNLSLGCRGARNLPPPHRPQGRMDVVGTLPQRVSSRTGPCPLPTEIAVIFFLLCLTSSLLLAFQRKASYIQISLSDSVIWKDLE